MALGWVWIFTYFFGRVWGWGWDGDDNKKCSTVLSGHPSFS